MIQFLKVLLVLLSVLLCLAMVTWWKGMYSFLFAWSLNWLLMVVVLYATVTFKPQLKGAYFSIKSWEKQGKIYIWFGVNLFRKLPVVTGWEKLNKAKNPVNSQIDTLRQLDYSTKQSEFGHLVIFSMVWI